MSVWEQETRKRACEKEITWEQADRQARKARRELDEAKRAVENARIAVCEKFEDVLEIRKLYGLQDISLQLAEH